MWRANIAHVCCFRWHSGSWRANIALWLLLHQFPLQCSQIVRDAARKCRFFHICSRVPKITNTKGHLTVNDGQVPWYSREDLPVYCASRVLRLFIQSAWTARCSMVHRTIELHARAFSGSNPSNNTKEYLVADGYQVLLALPRGFEPPTHGLGSLTRL